MYNRVLYKVPPKLGVLGPSFAKFEDEIKSQDEKSTLEKKKEGTKLLFSP